MYPRSTVPVLTPHKFKGTYFPNSRVHPKIDSWTPLMFGPVIVISSGLLIFLCYCIYFRFLRRETPAAASRHLPLPADEVELMPLGSPVFSCAICMDPPVQEMSTKCGHIFCKACIEAAIRAQGKCPTCREVLTPRDLIRVYLPSTR